jgi:hypothetical protein
MLPGLAHNPQFLPPYPEEPQLIRLIVAASCYELACSMWAINLTCLVYEVTKEWSNFVLVRTKGLLRLFFLIHL